jgi:hypothetical protein
VLEPALHSRLLQLIEISKQASGVNFVNERKRIHRWDKVSIFKALGVGAIIEAVAITPGLLSPWSHAGPETGLGWLSVLFNLPGLLLMGILGELPSGDLSVIHLVGRYS